MCSPSAHSFKPILDGGVRVLYCEHCGDVREIASSTHPYEYRGTLVSPQPMFSVSNDTNPQIPATEELERSVQELEADVLDRIRDGLGSGESWSSILARAGIDANSDFARSMAAKAGVQREVGFREVHDLPLFGGMNVSTPVAPPERGAVTELSPEERALIEESNRYEQRRRIVAEDDRLDAGL